jgi:hypothetical protein
MKYFEKFGHYCKLNYDGDEDSLKLFQKWTTIDPTSKLSLLHFNSHSAIINERKIQVQNHPFIIHPFSSFKMLWELIMILVYIFLLIYEPLQFLHLLKYKQWHVFWSFINVFSVIDIILRYFMGFWDENNFKVSTIQIKILIYVGTLPISYLSLFMLEQILYENEEEISCIYTKT